jgi:alkylation response protein AidB-like acyl-CoA dehydrogenase
MTDGAASLLSRHLSSPSLSPALRPIFASAFSRLISRDPAYAWTSGQWMTERPGGSDVSRTETTAVLSLSASHSLGTDGSPLGPWSVSGFKWFSSATDSDMAILLARTQTPSGNTEISAFFAPLRRMCPDAAGKDDSEPNGVAIQRLKSKLGTRALPTAELELRDMRAYLLGDEGQGVREISTILNITRVHNAVSAMGLWGRGLAVSRAFARVRVVRDGTMLVDMHAHVATMAALAVEYRAWMHLTFFTVLLLGTSEQDSSSAVVATLAPSSPSSPSIARLLPSAHARDHDAAVTATQLLLRLLTPIAKGITAKAAIAGLSECLESLGGVGYLENDEMELNVARLLRDASVLSIWEGTTEIMAADMLRVLKGPHGPAVLATLGAWLGEAVSEQARARAPWLAWRTIIEAADLQELMVDGRELMFALGRIVAGVLLVADADRDGDEVAREIARRWTGQAQRSTWQERVEWDRRIVFGDECGDRNAKL